MDIQLNETSSERSIRDLVQQAASGDTINTDQPGQFELLKKLLLEYKKVGLRLCLLDEDGYIVRQVSSRGRTTDRAPVQGFSAQQRQVLKALERVLQACEREKISLVGYSDSLVAVPTPLLHTDLASAEAREIESSDVYIGADTLKG